MALCFHCLVAVCSVGMCLFVRDPPPKKKKEVPLGSPLKPKKGPLKRRQTQSDKIRKWKQRRNAKRQLRLTCSAGRNGLNHETQVVRRLAVVNAGGTSPFFSTPNKEGHARYVKDG